MSAKVTQGEWIVEDGYAGAARNLFLVRPGCDGICFGITARDSADMELAAAAVNAITRAAARLGVDPLALARADVLGDAMEAQGIIDAMPVDGVTPFVIENMLRQAKDRAYAALSKLPSKEGR